LSTVLDTAFAAYLTQCLPWRREAGERARACVPIEEPFSIDGKPAGKSDDVLRHALLDLSVPPLLIHPLALLRQFAGQP